MFTKLVILLALLPCFASAAGKLQNADFATAAAITGAGGTVAQLLNTSKIYDSTNAQLLDTTLTAKLSSALNSTMILVGSAGNLATAVNMSGDATISNTGAVTIAADAVTNAKMADMATMTIKGNNTGGAANPIDLTATQTTAMLDTFTSGAKGLVPASGGGTTNFLRADGTFAAPAGTGDVVGPASSVDGEIALFDSTTGKLIKRASGTGFVKATSGVVSFQSSPIPAADINGGRTVNQQTGTTYQFVLSDGSAAGGFSLVSFDNASPVTVTVPDNATVAFPVGTQIDVTQLGAGAVTITPAGGVSVNTSSSLVMSQYAGGTLLKTATNTWQFYAGAAVSTGITALTGDVTASGSGSVAATIANLAVTNGKIANSTIDLTTKVTGILPNANTTADSANTNSAIVARDGSGNFSATTITAALSGNASTASALAANPADCAANQFATTIAANGDLTCAAIAAADLPATATSAIAASDIDWSTLKNVDGLYTKTLAANTTLTFSNVSAGQTVVIALTNTASNYTVTWPAAAKWSGGTAPTQTIGAKTDVYTCKAYDSTNAYCTAVQNY
jgi:hypothetical protein